MQKFFKSSFFILTITAIVCGPIGALLSGAWDFIPPPEEYYSYGNYIDGAVFGFWSAIIGLIPYWCFHAIVGDAFHNWSDTDNKKRRIFWVVCWATFLGWFFTMSLSV